MTVSAALLCQVSQGLILCSESEWYIVASCISESLGGMVGDVPSPLQLRPPLPLDLHTLLYSYT